jgi:hypothetical protein
MPWLRPRRSKGAERQETRQTGCLRTERHCRLFLDLHHIADFTIKNT